MNYEKAYCYFFNRTTDLIQLIKAVEPGKEQVNIALCLQEMQARAEAYCIEEDQKMSPTGS